MMMSNATHRQKIPGETQADSAEEPARVRRRLRDKSAPDVQSAPTKEQVVSDQQLPRACDSTPSKGDEVAKLFAGGER